MPTSHYHSRIMHWSDIRSCDASAVHTVAGSTLLLHPLAALPSRAHSRDCQDLTRIARPSHLVLGAADRQRAHEHCISLPPPQHPRSLLRTSPPPTPVPTRDLFLLLTLPPAPANTIDTERVPHLLLVLVGRLAALREAWWVDVVCRPTEFATTRRRSGFLVLCACYGVGGEVDVVCGEGGCCLVWSCCGPAC
jgi:hypothetical protein